MNVVAALKKMVGAYRNVLDEAPKPEVPDWPDSLDAVPGRGVLLPAGFASKIVHGTAPGCGVTRRQIMGGMGLPSYQVTFTREGVEWVFGYDMMDPLAPVTAVVVGKGGA